MVIAIVMDSPAADIYMKNESEVGKPVTAQCRKL